MNDRCTFCSLPSPVMASPRACICLSCARLAVEVLSPAGARGYFVACGCGETGRCTWGGDGEHCDCLCHNGEEIRVEATS